MQAESGSAQFVAALHVLLHEADARAWPVCRQSINHSSQMDMTKRDVCERRAKWPPAIVAEAMQELTKATPADLLAM